MIIRLKHRKFRLKGNFLFSLRLKLRLWEKGSFEVLDYYLKKNKSFIDIGAWIGPISLYAQKSCKKVYSVEPDPVAFKFLEDNILMNNSQKDIRIFPLAISDKNGKIVLGNPRRFGDSRSSILGKMKYRVYVDSLKFDDFIRRNKISDCNLIKIDIEGGEEIVLPLMNSYIKKNKPTLLLSLHPYNFSSLEKVSDKILNALKDYKYLYYTNREIIDLKKLKRDLMKTWHLKEIVCSDIKWER